MLYRDPIRKVLATIYFKNLSLILFLEFVMSKARKIIIGFLSRYESKSLVFFGKVTCYIIDKPHTPP